ncbi:hypothetical protein RF007C_01525 [Ruminococcus flavefaciens 007c]|uniref:Uncharacterized protein n=1 Tax=Ruminococcus flavefaciens 007c TaxID=1341157 RepID=W7UFH6_RUMFL|nr:hypothetical protein RF007C_01525 [Ruminococcus flavefaciens 007c]
MAIAMEIYEKIRYYSSQRSNISGCCFLYNITKNAETLILFAKSLYIC